MRAELDFRKIPGCEVNDCERGVAEKPFSELFEVVHPGGNETLTLQGRWGGRPRDSFGVSVIGLRYRE